MCEQQRCISVQRSIHRVEVNARPYSGPRKEREGGRIVGNRGRKREQREETRTTVVPGGRERGRERVRQGEEGRKGARARGGRSAAGWRAHISAEWKKMNKYPTRERASERANERERERETRQARSIPVRVSSSFSRAVSSLSLSLSLSLSPVVTLSQAISRLLFTMYRADWLFTPRAIPSTSNPRGDLLLFAYFRISRSLTLSLPPLSLSLSLSLARSISLFLLSVHETYFESARVYNKGPLRSMR